MPTKWVVEIKLSKVDVLILPQVDWKLACSENYRRVKWRFEESYTDNVSGCVTVMSLCLQQAPIKQVVGNLHRTVGASLIKMIGRRHHAWSQLV